MSALEWVAGLVLLVAVYLVGYIVGHVHGWKVCERKREEARDGQD